MCQPVYLDAVGKQVEVSITKGYAKNTEFAYQFDSVFSQIDYANKVYEWTNKIYSAYGTDDEDNALDEIGEILGETER